MGVSLFGGKRPHGTSGVGYGPSTSLHDLAHALRPMIRYTDDRTGDPLRAATCEYGDQPFEH
jgi:hypothetical protein